MEHEDTIPYYHNNIDENAQKIHTLLGNLLQKYGSVTDTKIYLRTFIAGTDEPETFVVPYSKLEWEDSDLQIRYVAGGFVEEAEKLKYNDQIDWTIEQTIGDEQEISHYTYTINMDDNGRVKVQWQTEEIQKTKAHLAEEAIWKAEQDAVRRPLKKGQLKFYVIPNRGTDEIAADLEMKLYFLEKAESLIS